MSAHGGHGVSESSSVARVRARSACHVEDEASLAEDRDEAGGRQSSREAGRASQCGRKKIMCVILRPHDSPSTSFLRGSCLSREGVTVQIGGRKWSAAARHVGALVGVRRRSARKRGPTASRVGCGRKQINPLPAPRPGDRRRSRPWPSRGTRALRNAGQDYAP